MSYVYNLRASYGAETDAWIAHLVDRLGRQTIALLYQDDGFRRVGLAGMTAALEKRGMILAAEGTDTRNIVVMKKALLAFRKVKPDAVAWSAPTNPLRNSSR